MKNKTLKRVLCFVLVFSLLLGCCLSFTGCDKKEENDKSDGESKADRYEGLEKAEYLQQLESDNLGAAIDSLGSFYSNLRGGMNGDAAGGKMELTVNVGDDLLALLEQAVFGGEVGDLSFLSKIKLGMDVGLKDEMEKLQMTLGLNDQDILTLNLLMNLADYVVYMGVPELNEQYLKVDAGQMMSGADLAELTAATSQMTVLMNALPDGEALTKLLNSYLAVVISELDNVKQSTATVEAGGVSQEATQLTLTLYEADAIRIAKAVLTKAKDDAELKKVVEALAEAVGELTDEDVGDVYAEFQESVADALTDLEEAAAEADTEEDPLVLTTYVDKKHNVIGRKLEVEESVVYYYAPADGDKVGFDLAVSDSQLPAVYHLRFVGAGTKKDGKLSGDYTLSVKGVEYLSVKAESLSEKGGTLIFDPTADGEQALELDALPFSDLRLELKLGDALELNITSADKLLLGVSLSAAASDGPSLSVPSYAADATDSSAMEAWAEKLVLDTILDNLRKAGAGDLIDALGVENLLGGSTEAPVFTDDAFAA